MIDVLKTDQGIKVIHYTVEMSNGEMIRKIFSSELMDNDFQTFKYLTLNLGVDKEEAKIGLDEVLRNDKCRANFGTQKNFIFSE